MEKTSSSKTVVISGGMDPVHQGHLSYIKEAMKLGDKLIIILSRDDQLITKKGYCFIPYEDRKAVLEAIIKDKGIVVENIDKDITSCRTLMFYNPDIFAKGSDTWDLNNLPEQAVCKELEIEVVLGVAVLTRLRVRVN